MVSETQSGALALINKTPIYSNTHLHTRIRVIGRNDIIPREFTSGRIKGVQIFNTDIGCERLDSEVHIGCDIGKLHFDGLRFLVEELTYQRRVAICLVRSIISQFLTKACKEVFKTQTAIITYLVAREQERYIDRRIPG